MELLEATGRGRRRIGARSFPIIRRPSPDLVAILVLIAFSALASVAFDYPRVRSDGLAYYLWLETLVRGHSLDLGPAIRQYAPFLTYQAVFNPRAGREVTQFPFGAAILWAPFYTAAQLLGNLRFHGIPLREPAYVNLQGQTYLYSLSIGLATWVYATIALVLAFLTARRLLGVRAAAFVAIALFLGTPLFYYTAVEPTMSHGVATFATTLALWLAARTDLLPLRAAPDWDLLAANKTDWRARFLDAAGTRPGYWAIVGLVVGLAGTIRWQLILLAIPLALAVLYRGRWTELLGLGVGTAIVFGSVPLSWLYLFGSPLPTAVGTVRNWSPRGLDLILVSPTSGLFAWSPVAILAVIGLAGLAASGPRRTGLLLILGFALEVAINGVAGDPTGGSSFGMRRLTEMYPVFVVGLAWLLRWVAARRGALPIWVYGATLLCVGFTLVLFVTYLRALIDPNSGTVVDAIVAWLPPRTLASLQAARAFHPFGFGT